MKLLNKDALIAREIKYYIMKEKLTEYMKLPAERELALSGAEGDCPLCAADAGDRRSDRGKRKERLLYKTAKDRRRTERNQLLFPKGA